MTNNINPLDIKMRLVRSFMRRNGRMSDLQRAAMSEIRPKYQLEITDKKKDWREVFGCDAPVFIEIGFGNGQALLDLAQNNPQYNYVGIEVYTVGIASLLLGIERLNLTNIRVFSIDAVDVFKHAIDASSLAGVMLYFPDPWPKKRHHKRRLVQKDFVDLVSSRLKKEGVWHMATDWAHYAEHMMAVMSARQDFLNPAGNASFYSGSIARPLTRFETKGLEQGHVTHELLFVKC